MKFACPNCQQHLEVDDSFAGTCVACPACGKGFVIAVMHSTETPPSTVTSSIAPGPEQETIAQPETVTPPPPPPTPPKAISKFRVVSHPEDLRNPVAKSTFRVVLHPAASDQAAGKPKFRVVSPSRPDNKIEDSPVFRIRDGRPSGNGQAAPSGKQTVEKVILHALEEPTLSSQAAKQGTSATIKASCPHCFRPCEVPESAMGTYVDCASCGKRFRIQKKSPALSVSGGNRRLSMTTALIFRSIVLLASIWATISWLIIMSMNEFEALPIPAFVFAVPAILSIVFSSILHFKCWSAIPENLARTTPGKAVGGLFIPFFNLFWVFPSIWGLGADCERLALNKRCKWEPRLKALGLSLAILMCASFAMLLLGEAFWLKIVAEDSMIIGDAEVDIVAIAISLLCWAANGIPVLGSLVAVAEFVTWMVFYRGVTLSLNRLATEANSPTPSP